MTLLDEQVDANAALAWRNFKAGTADNVLLDYSYAGYKHGEEAPADVWGLGYKVYNVVDYGADPTGVRSSRGALAALLKELKLSGRSDAGANLANANARAVVYFPEGRFVLHNDDDNVVDPTSANQKYTDSKGNNRSEEIFIRGGYFVLKGAGRGKTMLVMDTPNLPNNSEQMWSSPMMINIKHNSGLSDLTTVTGDAARGTFSVEVASAAGIGKGDWVCLSLSNNDPTLVAQELAPHRVEGNMTDIQTITVEDYHQVASVSGNRVTFAEPIMYAVEAKWGWKIRKYPHYEHVGVEDLTFEGRSKENFGHHASWEDDGATKRFVVEIRGVEQVKLSAPEGWSARLTDAVDERAELIVTAPAAVTRATADTSKDVAIEAFAAGGLSTVAKIQVESTGTAPAAPTVAVTNSATVEPTQSALTFDVAPSANADGWKYLCLKSTEAAPDAARVLAEGTAGAGTGVTVGNLEANTAYTIYVVAYAGDLTSEVASVGNTTAEAPVTAEADYYQDYQDGKDIALGDLTINKTVYPEAQLLKPSELTAAIITAGGLIFVDNSDAADLSFTISGASINMGDIVLIGRYPERAQATISGPELRCKYNAAFKNLHIAASGNYNLFTTTNATYDPTLHVEDCTVDAAYNVVYDSHNTQNFKSVYFGNSIVKMTVANKPFYSTKAKDAHTQQLIRLDNNVFYAETPLQNYLINCGDRSQAFQTTRLQVEVTNNTIYNIYQPNIMIRAYVLAGLTVTKNVGYYTGVTAKNYLTGVYDTAGFTADKAEVTYNYLYTAPVSDTNFWSAKHTGSYTPANNQMGDGVEAPFSSMDAAKGYFPVDASVVKTGAGATYDTKAWFKAE